MEYHLREIREKEISSLFSRARGVLWTSFNLVSFRRRNSSLYWSYYLGIFLHILSTFLLLLFFPLLPSKIPSNKSFYLPCS